VVITARSLLVAGNDKLGQMVMHFDIPAGLSCPGKSSLCHGKCYALKKRFLFPQVQERLRWSYLQAKRSDFPDRMCRELYRKGVLLMRFHVSGDIFSPAYARKILEIVRRSTHTSFWLYTRSWRVKNIAPVINDLSLLPNMKLWMSADSETGYPDFVPEGARVAWMKTEEEEDVERSDLIFLDHPLRRKTIPLTIIDKVCPTETPEGHAKGISCATCRYCWT
jgi:Gene product 88